MTEKINHMNRMRVFKRKALLRKLVPIVLAMKAEDPLMPLKSVAFKLNKMGHKTVNGRDWGLVSVSNYFSKYIINGY